MEGSLTSVEVPSSVKGYKGVRSSCSGFFLGGGRSTPFWRMINIENCEVCFQFLSCGAGGSHP